MVKQVGPGTQHVVILTTGSTESSSLPDFDTSVLELPDVPLDQLVQHEEEKKNMEKVSAEQSDN